MGKISYTKKRVKSFSYAFKGIWLLIKHEPNAQIHLFATCVVIFAGFFFNISRFEWLFILFAIGLVLAAEAFNSSVEKLTDGIYKEQNTNAGKIKDIAAGAVLICAIIAAIIGIIVFLPYIQRFLKF